MQIDIYPHTGNEPEIKPGTRFREWMSPYSYKCLPLAAANMFGWDILAPCRIEAIWNGEQDRDSVVIIDGAPLVEAHFGLGTLTLQAAHTWKTPPGVSLLVMPVPNGRWTGAQCMSAVLETDRLDYPWFVTMRIMQPGRVIIEQADPIARVVPVRIDDVVNAAITEKTLPDAVRQSSAPLRTRRMQGKGEWTQHYQRKALHTSIKSPEVSRMVRQEPIAPQAMLRDHGILAIDGYLDEDECRRCCNLHQGSTPVTSHDPFWKERVHHVEWPASVKVKLGQVPDLAAGFFCKQTLFDEGFTLVEWGEGIGMSAHSDFGRHGEFPSRQYACVLYLNDGFDGGEVYFPELGIEVVPEPGLLLVFPGGNVLHGVRKVTQGRRLTAISWLNGA